MSSLQTTSLVTSDAVITDLVYKMLSFDEPIYAAEIWDVNMNRPF
jgi:hypothetical protein